MSEEHVVPCEDLATRGTGEIPTSMMGFDVSVDVGISSIFFTAPRFRTHDTTAVHTMNLEMAGEIALSIKGIRTLIVGTAKRLLLRLVRRKVSALLLSTLQKSIGFG